MADEKDLLPFAIDSARLEGLNKKLLVAEGSYGSVVELKLDGVPCTGKKLHAILTSRNSVSATAREAVYAKFRSECLLLSRLRHPNIVQFLGVHFGRDRYDLTLIMERMHTDLETALLSFLDIPLPFKIRILLDASYGLLHLHSQSPPIVHRDFTASNILLSTDFRAKVADLGVSRILDTEPRQLCSQTICPGALAYMPPETLKPNPVYDEQLDIFSFGHMALFTAIQTFPVVHELEAKDASALRDGTSQIARRSMFLELMGGQASCLYDVITQCLLDSPSKRPSTAELNSTFQSLSQQHPCPDLMMKYVHCVSCTIIPITGTDILNE